MGWYVLTVCLLKIHSLGTLCNKRHSLENVFDMSIGDGFLTRLHIIVSSIFSRNSTKLIRWEYVSGPRKSSAGITFQSVLFFNQSDWLILEIWLIVNSLVVNGLLFPRRYVEQVTSPDILPPDFKNPYLYVPTHYFPTFL